VRPAEFNVQFGIGDSRSYRCMKLGRFGLLACNSDAALARIAKPLMARRHSEAGKRASIAATRRRSRTDVAAIDLEPSAVIRNSMVLLSLGRGARVMYPRDSKRWTAADSVDAATPR